MKKNEELKTGIKYGLYSVGLISIIISCLLFVVSMLSLPIEIVPLLLGIILIFGGLLIK